MNDDLISRQAVFDLMRSLTRWCVRSENGKFNNVGLLYDDVMFGIDKLPPVTPQEPKTGHWIKDDITERSKSAYKHKCDRCGAYHRAMYDYCPSCGARMIESEV